MARETMTVRIQPQTRKALDGIDEPGVNRTLARLRKK
jgi:hypothetical protein